MFPKLVCICTHHACSPKLGRQNKHTKTFLFYRSTIHLVWYHVYFVQPHCLITTLPRVLFIFNKKRVLFVVTSFRSVFSRPTYQVSRTLRPWSEGVFYPARSPAGSVQRAGPTPPPAARRPRTASPRSSGPGLSLSPHAPLHWLPSGR